MRSFVRLLTAVAVAAGLLVIAPTARADENYVESTPCDRTIYVFTGYRVGTQDNFVRYSPATTEAACLAVSDADGIDPRVIYPGTNVISIRATFEVPEDGSPIPGRVIHPNGTVTEVTLVPSRRIDDSCCLLDSEHVAIDPQATGYYRVEIDLPLESGAVFTYADEYRTLGEPSRADGYIP